MNFLNFPKMGAFNFQPNEQQIFQLRRFSDNFPTIQNLANQLLPAMKPLLIKLTNPNTRISVKKSCSPSKTNQRHLMLLNWSHTIKWLLNIHAFCNVNVIHGQNPQPDNCQCQVVNIILIQHNITKHLYCTECWVRWNLAKSTIFYAQKQLLRSVHISHRNSVCPSVHHMGGLVKNGAS